MADALVTGKVMQADAGKLENHPRMKIVELSRFVTLMFPGKELKNVRKKTP